MSLEIDKLSKRYRNKWVFRDLTFSAEAGKVTGVFGPAGCGKTTLLELIAGREKPGSGSIRGVDDGKVFFLESRELEKRIRLPFFGAKHSGDTLIDRANRIFDTDAGIVLLDSPFAGMDLPAKESLIDKIKDLAKANNAAVIYASSDFSEILQFCDAAVAIEKGVAMQFDTPQNIYDAPATVEIARLTGPNNLFEARRLTKSNTDMQEFQTIVGEHRLFGGRSDVRSMGAIHKNLMLGIRPEQIAMSLGASFPEDNLLKASIVRIKPRGAETRVELDSNGLRLEALVPRLIGMNIGDECMIGLPPDRIRPFAR
jgi:ABC-type Fe3+/spermidine/putrescine transport system ATPase subunit